MEINRNKATKLSQDDIKILQSISIELRGLSFLANNGKQTMENYLLNLKSYFLHFLNS